MKRGSDRKNPQACKTSKGAARKMRLLFPLRLRQRRFLRPAQHITLNRLHLLRRQNIGKRRHAEFVQHAAAHDVLEILCVDSTERRRSGTSPPLTTLAPWQRAQYVANSFDPSATWAEVTASLNVGIGIGGSGQVNDFHFSGSTERVDGQPATAHLAFADRAIIQYGRAAPSGHHGHVLRSVERIGHGPGDNSDAGIELPQRLAVGRAVGFKFSVGAALEDQVAGRGQRAATLRETAGRRARLPCAPPGPTRAGSRKPAPWRTDPSPGRGKRGRSR